MTTPFEQRRRAEARRRLRRRALVLAVAVAPPALLAGLAWSPLLDVDRVRVVGAYRVPASGVRKTARIADGAPLVTLDLAGARRRVAALRGVRSVTVTRSWAGTVTIRVVERVPVVAVHRDGRYDLYDVDGVAVATVAALPPGTPPLDVAGEPTAAVVTATVDLLRALPPELRAQVRDLAADANGLLTFALADGAQVVWGSADRTPDKVRALTLLLPRHANRYDLRVPDQPAVTPR